MSAPADFPRSFAAAFGVQDAEALAALFAENGSFHCLTGQFCDGRPAITKGLAAEFSGLSRMARLVSGKSALTPIGPGAGILHQRYVVTALRWITAASTAAGMRSGHRCRLAGRQ